MPKSFSEKVQEAAESMSEQGLVTFGRAEFSEFVAVDRDVESLERFRARYRTEAARWRDDPRHIPVLPSPIMWNKEAHVMDIEDELGIACLPEEPQDLLQPRRKIEV